MAKKEKRYEDLTIADDFMFCKIFIAHEDLCREMTELILNRKVGRIVELGSQKPVEITSDGRGVRFDVYVADDMDTIYNIEMQVGKVSELPFRTRYYQGMIDLDRMERGTKFKDLKTTYIIFICIDNLYPDIGFHKYSFSSTCAEVPNLELKDGVYKVILSAKGTQDDVTEDLKAFLEYVAGKAPASDFTKRLDDKVKEAREHIEWRKEYMTLLERDERMREEGREEERVKTEMEAARANAAEKEASEAKREASAFREELERTKAILTALTKKYGISEQ